jgi:hypothetical protein
MRKVIMEYEIMKYYPPCLRSELHNWQLINVTTCKVCGMKRVVSTSEESSRIGKIDVITHKVFDKNNELITHVIMHGEKIHEVILDGSSYSHKDEHNNNRE